jgi:hypothetical protein
VARQRAHLRRARARAPLTAPRRAPTPSLPAQVLPVEIEGVVHYVYVCKRPGCDIFLEQLGRLFEVVVFTVSAGEGGARGGSARESKAGARKAGARKGGHARALDAGVLARGSRTRGGRARTRVLGTLACWARSRTQRAGRA